MPVFVKASMRGRSIVKAYTRNIAHTKVLNNRFNQVKRVKTYGGSALKHMAHADLAGKLNKAGTRTRSQLRNLVSKYKTGAAALGRPVDERSINQFLSGVSRRAGRRY